MFTLCWSAKGGSGTTSVVAALGLAARRPTLLVDLAGELAPVLGLGDDDGAQLTEWFASGAPPERLTRLERRVCDDVDVLPTDRSIGRVDQARWQALGAHLRSTGERRDVIVDGGLGPPPESLASFADRSLLVTRPCYLSLRRAAAMSTRPTGVVLVDEPGRALTAEDVLAALGVPVVATILLDPKIARAVDAGMLTSRLPNACLAELRAAS